MYAHAFMLRFTAVPFPFEPKLKQNECWRLCGGSVIFSGNLYVDIKRQTILTWVLYVIDLNQDGQSF